MHHRMADFHSCRISVENHAAYLAFENGDKVPVGREVFLGSDERCSQMAFQCLRSFEHLLAGAGVNKQSSRAEDFF